MRTNLRSSVSKKTIYPNYPKFGTRRKNLTIVKEPYGLTGAVLYISSELAILTNFPKIASTIFCQALSAILARKDLTGKSC